MGICLRESGQVDEALAEFRKSLEIDPKHWQTWLNLGVVSLFDKGDAATAETAFGKVEELMHHQLIVHENKLYLCDKCSMGFEGMEQMRDHAKKFHSYNKQVEERKRSDGL